jgi:hypothetical protein
MDLIALQDDSNALRMAASAVETAAQRESEVIARLAGVWSGAGAAAAQDFLTRQNDASAAVRDGLVTAAAALATLRDDLWQAVDAKVNAALDIDDRPSGSRGQWLAAAHTVTTGAGDVATASELVDQQVKPFVDNDIGAEWLSEMRAGFDRVTAAFDAAIAKLEDCPAARIDAAAPPDAAPAVAAPPVSAPPSGELGGGVPSLGGGMPSLGGGLSGFGQQLADLIGGLTGSGDALPDVEGLSEPDGLQPEPEPELEDEGEDEDEPGREEDEVPDEEPADIDETVSQEGDLDEEQPVEASPEPMSVPEQIAPPIAPPPALPDVLPAERTPCEIAAEELPQVGQ